MKNLQYKLEKSALNFLHNVKAKCDDLSDRITYGSDYNRFVSLVNDVDNILTKIDPICIAGHNTDKQCLSAYKLEARSLVRNWFASKGHYGVLRMLDECHIFDQMLVVFDFWFGYQTRDSFYVAKMTEATKSICYKLDSFLENLDGSGENLEEESSVVIGS